MTLLAGVAVVLFATPTLAADDPPFPFNIPGLTIDRADDAEENAAQAARSDFDPALLGLLDRLGADDFTQREAATLELAQDARWRDEVLGDLIRSGLCSAEQRERIASVLLTRFGNSTRAALGIRMKPGAHDIGVHIESVQEGFPAHRFLQSDDIILKVGSVDLRANPTDQALRAAILSHDPGDIVRFSVLRRDPDSGRQSEVSCEVPLVGYDALNLGNPGITQPSPNAADLAAAWRIRAQRYGLDGFSDGVARADMPRQSWELASRRPVMLAQADAGIVAGGRPVTIDPAAARAAVQRRATVQVQPGVQVQRVAPAEGLPVRDNPIADRLRAVEGEAEKIQQLLENRALTDDDRAVLEERLKSAQAMQAILERLQTREQE